MDPAALRRTKWHEYAIRFALGGIVTVLAGLVARRWGPAVGGLFLAFPAIFPAAATLVARHERNRKKENGVPPGRRGEKAAAVESSGAVLGSAALAVFAGLNWYLLGGGRPVWVLALAMAAWLAAGAAFWAAWKFRRRLTLAARRSPASLRAGREN